MPRIGLISDTHGLLRDEAIDVLHGCDHIIHAGDVGNEFILERLSALAPLTAVRGNNDRGSWAKALSQTRLLKFGETLVYVVHDIADLDIDTADHGAARVRVVVSGHSHVSKIQRKEAVLFVNPGSAGPRRFKLPITVGELTIDGAEAVARIIELRVGSA